MIFDILQIQFAAFREFNILYFSSAIKSFF